MSLSLAAVAELFRLLILIIDDADEEECANDDEKMQVICR